MKTLILQGTQKQFEKLYRSITLDDKDRNLVPIEVETRVYIIDSSYAIPTSDEDFITLAEQLGRVYTLQGFQKAFNEEETISSTIDYIRIISVPLFL